jgi:hypothetical protein
VCLLTHSALVDRFVSSCPRTEEKIGAIPGDPAARRGGFEERESVPYGGPELVARTVAYLAVFIQ